MTSIDGLAIDRKSCLTTIYTHTLVHTLTGFVVTRIREGGAQQEGVTGLTHPEVMGGVTGTQYCLVVMTTLNNHPVNIYMYLISPLPHMYTCNIH